MSYITSMRGRRKPPKLRKRVLLPGTPYILYKVYLQSFNDSGGGIRIYEVFPDGTRARLCTAKGLLGSLIRERLLEMIRLKKGDEYLASLSSPWAVAMEGVEAARFILPSIICSRWNPRHYKTNALGRLHTLVWEYCIAMPPEAPAFFLSEIMKALNRGIQPGRTWPIFKDNIPVRAWRAFFSHLIVPIELELADTELVEIDGKQKVLDKVDWSLYSGRKSKGTSPQKEEHRGHEGEADGAGEEDPEGAGGD